MLTIVSKHFHSPHSHLREKLNDFLLFSFQSRIWKHYVVLVICWYLTNYLKTQRLKITVFYFAHISAIWAALWAGLNHCSLLCRASTGITWLGAGMDGLFIKSQGLSQWFHHVFCSAQEPQNIELWQLRAHKSVNVPREPWLETSSFLGPSLGSHFCIVCRSGRSLRPAQIQGKGIYLFIWGI